MKGASKNDFSKTEVIEKSKYRLWVKYHIIYVNEKLPEKKVYYSYEKAGNPGYGYNKLIALMLRNKSKIQVAILYNNLSGEEIERFSF